jgi:hypothetical protein
MKRKAMMLSKKGEKNIATSNRKRIKRFQKMHLTRILKNKKSKRFQPYKRLLYEEIILVVI